MISASVNHLRWPVLCGFLEPLVHLIEENAAPHQHLISRYI